MQSEILNRVTQVGLTEQMASEQRLEGGKKGGQAYVGEEHPSPWTHRWQVAQNVQGIVRRLVCPEQRSKESLRLYRALLTTVKTGF